MRERTALKFARLLAKFDGAIRIRSPEEIARTLVAMDKVAPFILTAEESDAEMIRQKADKAWERSQFEQRGEQLRKIWE